jgi:hypothetical protein
MIALTDVSKSCLNDFIVIDEVKLSDIVNLIVQLRNDVN